MYFMLKNITAMINLPNFWGSINYNIPDIESYLNNIIIKFILFNISI